MFAIRGVLMLAALAPCVALAAAAPNYTKNGELTAPPNYRDWVLVTDAPGPGREALDDVFVNPEAYRAFVKTGAWPDKTVLLKEKRTGADVSLELQVKDEARFPGKWAFFAVRGGVPARPAPPNAGCYICHGDQGAVDTTFVQFYPKLLAAAEAKGTLSDSFRLLYGK